MSGSNWRSVDKHSLVAAAIIGVGIALYWTMFFDLGYYSGRNDERTDIQSEHYARDAAENMEKSCGRMSGAALRECAYQVAKSEHEGKRNESDLAAQWNAADWTRWATIVAALQVIATIVGLYFIKRTLDATWEAVEDTGKATKAMERQNEISEETAHRQLRAYVIIREANVENIGAGQNPDISYNLVNVGQTPAYDVRHVARVFSATSEKDASWQKVFFGELPLMSKATLGPNSPAPGGFNAFATGVMVQPVYNAIMAGQLILGLFGAITYRDIFGRRHITTFKMMLPTQYIKDGGGNLVACEKGNRAN